MQICIDFSQKLKRPTIILIFITLGFLLITGFFYQNKALSLHFVDEEHNFALGQFILFGDKLYADTFTNHQPLAFIFSAAIQKITHPNSIFLLVKRHREVMIVLSAVWSLFLVSKFGLLPLIFLIFYELTKIRLLGNLFLAESLVIYPLIYLLCLVFLREGKLNRVELLLAGFSFATIVFLFAPLAPLVFIIFLLLFYRQPDRFLAIIFILMGILPILIITFWFASFFYYFRYAIYFNLKYFIPQNFPEPIFITLIKAFSAPILAFFPKTVSSPTLTIIRIFSLLLLLNTSLLLIKKKFYPVFISIFILSLTNLRFIEAGQEYYRGFHLLPWFATLIFLTVVTSFCILRKQYSIFIKAIIVLLLIVSTIPIFKQAQSDFFRKRDLAKDLYVNYSQQFTIGEAIRIMNAQSSQETLLVLPDEWLVYWQSGLRPPFRVNSSYGWQLQELKSELDLMLTQNLPAYFYCKCQGYGLDNTLMKYHELIKDGNRTQLYVLPSKLERLNRYQKDQLKFYGFEI